MVLTNDLSKKSAFITIVGRPNVGKSSLINAMVGQKISIVSRKPQTTRTRIMGILTDSDTQLIFIDTPGIHASHNALDRRMAMQINNSMLDVDVCALVVESGKKIFNEEKEIINRIKKLKIPTILIINKIDLTKNKSEIINQINEFSSLFRFDAVVPISVTKNDGINDVISEFKKFTYEGGFIFESDALTNQPERVLISEIIREKLLRMLDKEVPHGIAVQVDRMKERSENIVDIYATIYCEKASHKGIIIGKQGLMLKKVGSLSRQDIEKFLNCKVNLQLWVKIKEDWRNKENLITSFINELKY